MNLYIKVKDGLPINHPAFKDNLIQAFGEVPAGWEPFIRVEQPITGPYQILESREATYQKIDGVWTDVWSVRDMTAEEKTATQEATRNMINSHEFAFNWSTWILNEATCIMEPPIPRPEEDSAKTDANIYTFWCGADNNWRDTPVRPEGDYKFDFFAWEWVPVVNDA